MKKIILFIILSVVTLYPQNIRIDQIRRLPDTLAYMLMNFTGDSAGIAGYVTKRLGVRWVTPQMYSTEDIGNGVINAATAFNAAMLDITGGAGESFGTDPAILYVPAGNYNFETVVTFPASVDVIMQNGAIFLDSVVMQGNLTAGLYKIFDTGANLEDANIPGVWAEWFGAVGDSATESQTYINRAIKSLGTSGGNVYIGEGIFLIDVEENTRSGDNNSGIQMASNVNLRMQKNTTLQAITTDSSSYEIISAINVDRAGVYGGNIRGERTSHTGVGGEWGMGIYLIHATNFVVSETYITNCWGDGIYISDNNQHGGYYNLPSVNVTIDKVTCENNRRQGLSAINWTSGSITNSFFLGTNGTSPESGIDFEPNDADSQNVVGITVTGNTLNDNAGYGILLANTLTGYRNYIHNNYFEDNTLGNFGTLQNSLVLGNGAAYNLSYAGSNNTFIGTMAGRAATTAVGNTAIGDSAGYNLTLGDRNIIVGSYGSSGGITTGSDNILIGRDVRYSTGVGDNTQLNIGNLIYGYGVASGDTLSTGNVGIKAPYPSYDLHVSGTTKTDTMVIGNNISYVDGELSISVHPSITTEWDYGFDTPSTIGDTLGSFFVQSDGTGYSFNFAFKDTDGVFLTENFRITDDGTTTISHLVTGTWESSTGRFATPNHPNRSLDSTYTRFDDLDTLLIPLNLTNITGSDYSGGFKTNRKLEIKRVDVVMRTSATSDDDADINVYWAANVMDGSPTTLWTSDETITDTTTGHAYTSFDNTVIDKNSWVWLQCNALTGTVNQIWATIVARKKDD